MSDSRRRTVVRSPRAAALATLLGLLAASPLAAQCCLTGLSTQPYGQGCNPVTSVPPRITAGYSMQLHALVVRVRDMNACCTPGPDARALALGASATSQPLPQIGPGCALLVQPFATLLQPTAGCCDVFTIALPAAVQPGSFFAQGALLYAPTATSAGGVALSPGLRIDLL